MDPHLRPKELVSYTWLVTDIGASMETSLPLNLGLETLILSARGVFRHPWSPWNL